ncbi:MAG: glycosyltransferase family 2 protein [Deltaproteobacteria bacterium]|nr:glycosyltransferase family 2 protein [Deltaproteobacteria bacterium]
MPDAQDGEDLGEASEAQGEVFFSIVIPAHNEEGCIEETCTSIVRQLAAERIEDYEILVVDDNSSDRTEAILQQLAAAHSRIRYVTNRPPHGFGFAVRRGLECFRGECVCIVMADLSDSPEDIVQYYRRMKAGAECVFGSRFVPGSRVVDYPGFKKVLNRLANHFIKAAFRIDHDDITNAFKCYRREVIEGIAPLLSHHFNLTVEMPLKAIVRGYQFEALPISWTNRKAGESKLVIKEMGSRYLFITLYVLLEQLLSRGDYHRRKRDSREKPAASEREA